MTKFSGDWNSYYRYPSTGRGDDFWGQHQLHATQTGSRLVFETGPESASHVLVELELGDDGKVATGVWAEDTDPDGYYKGRKYEGTIKLRIAKGGTRMNGVWHGAGKDGTMHTDIWELVKAEDPKLPQEAPKLWHAAYWFPSNHADEDRESAYDLKGYRDQNTLILESLPNEEHSYMLIRLKVDNDLATGYWYESTSPTGEFKGVQYSGAGQLIVDPKTYRMEGSWSGAGYDHKLNKMRIYTGRWEVAPLE